jgi:hypothetical protein
VPEVIEVMKRLQNHEKFKVVRIKDRLNTGNQDFLVNLKMKDCGVLCEVQVGFKTQADEKMVFLDHFNHFLYELARSEYGPLAESTLIASNLTLFNGFYDKSMKTIGNQKSSPTKSVAISKDEDTITIDGFKSQNN